jgi:hypothetical protein
MSNINHSCPDVGQDEIDALIGCIHSGQLKGADNLRLLKRQIAGDLAYRDESSASPPRYWRLAEESDSQNRPGSNMGPLPGHGRME